MDPDPGLFDHLLSNRHDGQAFKLAFVVQRGLHQPRSPVLAGLSAEGLRRQR